MSSRLTCPWCRKPVLAEDILCPACGLLLETEDSTSEQLGSAEPPPTQTRTIVEALLSPRLLTRTQHFRVPPPPAPQRGAEMKATQFFTPLSGSTVPHLRMSLGQMNQPLNAFEAYVASFIDGEHTLCEIAQQAGLTEPEVAAVLRQLSEQKLVELERPAPRAPRPQPLEPSLAQPQDTEPVLLGEDDPPTMLELQVPAQQQVEPQAEEEQPLFELQEHEVVEPSYETLERSTLREIQLPMDRTPLPSHRQQTQTKTLLMDEVPTESPSSPFLQGRPAPMPVVITPTLPERLPPGARLSPQTLPPPAPAPAAAQPPPPAPPRQTPPAVPARAPKEQAWEQTWEQTGEQTWEQTGEQTQELPRPQAHEQTRVARPSRTLTPMATPLMTPAAPAAAPPPASHNSQAQEVLERAIRLERSGQADAAIDLLAAAIAQVEHSAPLYNKLALILVHQRQDYERAKALLHTALAAEPDNAVCRRNLQQVLDMEANSKKARQQRVWSALVKRRPT